MDMAPWELGVNEKSKPKLNTVGMQCQRKDIAQWLQTFWSLLQRLQHNLCVSQVPGCTVIFQTQTAFGSCGDASSPAFFLTIAKVATFRYLLCFTVVCDSWPVWGCSHWAQLSLMCSCDMSKGGGQWRPRSTVCHCWIVWRHHFLTARRCWRGLERALFLAELYF